MRSCFITSVGFFLDICDLKFGGTHALKPVLHYKVVPSNRQKGVAASGGKHGLSKYLV